MKSKNAFFSLIISICFLLAAYPSYTADEFLSTCLKFAEARNKKIAVAQEQIYLSNTRIFSSSRQFFPTLGLEDNIQKGKTITDQYQSEQIALKATQPIYQGGKLTATYRHDSLLRDAARFNYTKTREEVFGAVKLAYYEYLSSEMQFNALSSAYDDIEKLHKKVISEYKARAISELDLIESENFRDKVKDMLENTKDDIALSQKKLLLLLNIDNIQEIPLPLPDTLQEDVQEITFSLDDCINFARLNNIDVVSSQLQIKVSEQKQKIVKSRLVPSLFVDGSYGQAGEAEVTQPLDLATTWSLYGRLSWGLWGNSLEASQGSDTTDPKLITDPYAKINNTTTDVKLSILDDTNYFVQAKETDVGNKQAKSDYTDALNKSTLDVMKNYTDFKSSFRDIRTYRNEIILKKRKLAYLKKRNDLFEIPTVQLMEESWKYAETLASYAKSLNKNYAAVTELERLTLVPMR